MACFACGGGSFVVELSSHTSHRQRLNESVGGFVKRSHLMYSEKNLSPLSGGSNSVFLNGACWYDTPTASAILLMWFNSE